MNLPSVGTIRVVTTVADIPVVRWADRMADREAALARVARLRAAAGRPYTRMRLRDPDEARLLRARGTPERFIGPSGS